MDTMAAKPRWYFHITIIYYRKPLDARFIGFVDKTKWPNASFIGMI